MRQVDVPEILAFYDDHRQHVLYVGVLSLDTAVVVRGIKAGRHQKQSVQLARSKGELGVYEIL